MFFHKYRYGRVSGIASILVGVLFLAINFYTLLYKEFYYPKLLVTGIALLPLGLSLIIFPGGKFSKNDYPDQHIGLKMMWQLAPAIHRAAWCVAAVVGFGAGFYFMKHFIAQ